MKLGKLIEFQKNGVLNIKYESGSSTATLGGVTIDRDSAVQIVNNLGWTEYVLDPFEIIDKTNKFARGLKSHLKDKILLENTEVIFQNKRGNTYGKTFDRIVFEFPRVFSYSIIYNMENSGGKYVIYEVGKALPLKKCRNLKAVSEFINKRGE